MSADRVAELAALFDGRREALVASLRQLVERESPSDDPARVGELARWIAGRLRSAGIPAECVPCAGRGDALLSRGSGDGGTLLLGHLDTVWPAGTLAERPFRVEGGVAKGPGVFDMKGGLAVALEVLEAVGRGEVRPAPLEESGQLGHAVRAHARNSFRATVTFSRTSRLTVTPIPGPDGTGIRPAVASSGGVTMSSSK